VAVDAGGFLDTPNQRLPIAHDSAIARPEDLARIVVAHRNGVSLRLGDVAEVVEGFPPPIGDAVIHDMPGLLLIVERQPWGSTLELTRGVEAALEELRPGLADVHIDSSIFRPATFIEISLANLQRALWIGCLLVIGVLGFFLRDWRSALIPALAIPLSLLTAALAIRYRGGPLDTMVLAGLAIALGEVVDDAIIDVENIVRRLRLNRSAGSPRSALQVVLAASLEVRSGVVYASCIVALVFVPLLLLGGLAGSFFRPLALAYVLAVSASLAVALTVTPALALLLLPRAEPRRGEPPLVQSLKRRYRQMLPSALDRPQHALRCVGAALGATLLAYLFLGEDFLPRFHEYDFLLHWVEKPGTSLEAMQRITVRASRELRAIPGVRGFGSHIGRAEVSDAVVGANFTELWISLDPKVAYQPTLARVQEVVDGYPGLYRDLLTYLRERVQDALSGASASLVVRLYGPNLEVLRAKASEVRNAIADIPGVTELRVQPQILVPQIAVHFRPEAAERFGLTPGAVRRAAATLIQGTRVGQFYEDQRISDVVVWGAPRLRSDVETLRSLPIDTPEGGMVPLRDVAEVVVEPSPSEITREGASRRIDVTCNVRGRSLGSVAAEIEQKVRGLHFERGYHPAFLGEWAAQQESRQRLLWLSLISLIGVFLILHADFGSARLALLVFAGLPFAWIGSVIAVVCSGGVLSLGSLIGFVTVLGVAARNGIMLVSHCRHLEQVEGLLFGRELVLRGAEERLVPILMTALATGLALLPIVIGGNRPGYEIEHPMAVVILGGLVTSTALNLWLMPALVLHWGEGGPLEWVAAWLRTRGRGRGATSGAGSANPRRPALP
jgi:CzcA family heavy metal efflux pump